MNYRPKKVVVLGSGVMGSGIACHLANVGMDVIMLDIVTPKLSDNDSKSKFHRNKLVNSALQKTIKSKPDPLYHKSFSSRIKTGNFEDDFDKISESESNSRFAYKAGTTTQDFSAKSFKFITSKDPKLKISPSDFLELAAIKNASTTSST